MPESDPGSFAPDPLEPWPVIYDRPGIESILDGSLNGVQPFTCRVLVDRETRLAHGDPEAVSHQQYRELVADTVQALTVRGLRTAVYCTIGGQSEQFAQVIGNRHIAPHGRSRPIKAEVIGNYLQSAKENTATVRAFNGGKVDALVASRLFETQTDITADALVIAARSSSRHVLQRLLLNFVAPNPEHPNLTVVELIEIAGGNSGRASYTVWDLLREKEIRQGKLVGGHLDARPDPGKNFTLGHMPPHLRARFEQLEGSRTVAVAKTTSSAEDFEPIPADMVPLGAIAAGFTHIPPKSVRYRLEQGAGLRPRVVWEEKDGNLVQVPYYSASEAEAYFKENPVPPLAEPGMETVAGLCRKFGASQELINTVIAENAGVLQAERRLQPGKLREREYYDESAQQIIGAGVLEHRARAQAVQSAAAFQRSLKKQYQEPGEGDVQLAALCQQAGVSYSFAKDLVADQFEVGIRKEAKGVPAIYVLGADVDAVLKMITPQTLPVDRITAPAMHKRMAHRSPRAVANHLVGFPSIRRRLPGRGPEVLDYPWLALRHVEEKLGVAPGAIPIVWDLLPADAATATPEQISYARALQILYQPAVRLGAAAIMSPDTARLFATAAYEMTSGRAASEAEPVAIEPDEAVVISEETADVAEPAIEPAPESVPLEPIWVTKFVDTHNATHDIPTTEKEILNIANHIRAEVAYERGVPFLTADGRRTLEEYITSPRPAPEGWWRFKDVADALGLGYLTVVQELSDDTDNTGIFQVRQGMLLAGHYVSPARAADLAKAHLMQRLTSRGGEMTTAQISLLSGRSPGEVEARITAIAPGEAAEKYAGKTYAGQLLRQVLAALGVEIAVPAPAQSPPPAQQATAATRQPLVPPRERTNIERLVAASKSPAQPRIQSESIITAGRPLSILDIAQITQRQPQMVRDAIAAARRQLGKKFRSHQQRDKWQVETEHFADRAVLQTIEDHLLGIHQSRLLARLQIDPAQAEEVKSFLIEMNFRPNAEGRFSMEAFEAAREYFAKPAGS